MDEGICMSYNNLKYNSRLIILALLASIILSLSVPLIKEHINISSAKDNGEPIISWDFSNNQDPIEWAYRFEEDSNYSGIENSSIEEKSGMLVLNVDYSQNAKTNYSQAEVEYTGNLPLHMKDSNYASLDFYYDSSLLDGSFLVKLSSSDCNINKIVAIDTSKSEKYSGTIKKVKVSFEFDSITQEDTNNLSFMIIGNNTSYNGELFIDNIEFIKK